MRKPKPISRKMAIRNRILTGCVLLGLLLLVLTVVSNLTVVYCSLNLSSTYHWSHHKRQHSFVQRHRSPVSQTAQPGQSDAPLTEAMQQKLLNTTETLQQAANMTSDTVRLSADKLHKAAAQLRSFQGAYPVGEQDLLIAFPADEQHLPIVQAGRQWHKACFVCSPLMWTVPACAI